VPRIAPDSYCRHSAPERNVQAPAFAECRAFSVELDRSNIFTAASEQPRKQLLSLAARKGDAVHCPSQQKSRGQFLPSSHPAPPYLPPVRPMSCVQRFNQKRQRGRADYGGHSSPFGMGIDKPNVRLSPTLTQIPQRITKRSRLRSTSPAIPTPGPRMSLPVPSTMSPAQPRQRRQANPLPPAIAAGLFR
jgi:hypothetical protein